jgi:GT2 family glycosyltransferase
VTPAALSVVIPTFNTAQMTLTCCRAVLAAAPEATELIVVDDASTDDTHARLQREVPTVRVLRLETNRRFSGAANAGVAVASGDIILLLNSDAVVEPDALTSLLAAFANDAQLGVAGARLLNADGTPQWSGGPVPALPWLVVLAGGVASLLPRRTRASGGAPVAWVSGAAMAFRRVVWDAAGPLDERYRFYAQDLDFCLRARAEGWDVRLVEESRVVHAAGATVRQWRGLTELPHDPALLWPDLLRWTRGHYGPVYAAAARELMSAAVVMRIAARRMRELLLRGPSRERSRSTTATYVAALRQLLVEGDETAGQDAGGVAAAGEEPGGIAKRPRP